MARITVEDCIDKFPSRFELVLVASNRARKLYAGEKPTVDIDNDKNTVIALREIADETVSKEQLKNDLISEYQTNTFSEDDIIDEIEDNSEDFQSQENEAIEDNIEKIDYNDNQDVNEASTETSNDNLDRSSDENKVQDL